MRLASCRCATATACRIPSCRRPRTTSSPCQPMNEPRVDLAALLRHDAVHYGDRVAIRLDGRELTYRGLSRAVAETAQALGQHVAAGDRVALWFNNSFN